MHISIAGLLLALEWQLLTDRFQLWPEGVATDQRFRTYWPKQGLAGARMWDYVGGPQVTILLQDSDLCWISRTLPPPNRSKETKTEPEVLPYACSSQTLVLPISPALSMPLVAANGSRGRGIPRTWLGKDTHSDVVGF